MKRHKAGAGVQTRSKSEQHAPARAFESVAEGDVKFASLPDDPFDYRVQWTGSRCGSISLINKKTKSMWYVHCSLCSQGLHFTALLY